MVTNGGGATGSLVIQLAAAMGVEVTTTASGSAADRLRGLGAAEIIDYHDPNWPGQARGGFDGALTAAIAVGSMLAGLFSGVLTRVRWQGQVIAGAITVWGLAVAGFGLVLVAVGKDSPDHLIWWAMIAAFLMLVVAGGADAISAVFRQTILQTATPDDMRGRLQGVFIVVVAGGPRLGDLWVGTLSRWLGEAWAVVLGGCLCVVLLWLLVRVQRTFLAYDARHPVA